MRTSRTAQALVALAVMNQVAACQLEVGELATHPDRQRDAQVADAGPSEGARDGGADAASEPVLGDFRDDFQRPEGPVNGAMWQDTGPGTPSLWNGELCLWAEEQVRTRLEPGPYGYVQLEVATEAYFELRLEGDRGPMLVLFWYPDQTLGRSDGSTVYDGLEPDSVSRLRMRLDYAEQAVHLQLDARPEQILPFESDAPASRLTAVALANQHPPDSSWLLGMPIEYPLSARASCVDNVLVAQQEPREDPFGKQPGALACTPVPWETGAQQCERRNCCSEQLAMNRCVADCYDGDGSTDYEACIQLCAHGPLAQKLSACGDAHCSGSNVQERP